VTSLGDEHNPYAAPQAELQVQSVQSGTSAFYPMSSRKAAVMTVLTFGFYDLVFWFRHWNRLQDNGHDVTPLFRAFFAGFTSFGFVTRLCTARAERGLESGSGLRASPGIYLALNLASRLSDRLLDGVAGLAFTMLACAGAAWTLATIQDAANEVLEADNYRGPSNSGVSGGAIFAGAIGLILWFFVIAGSVMPEWFLE
jgi:hypothetical protein